MAKRLDDLLRGFGVDPDQRPEPKAPPRERNHFHSTSVLPSRFVRLLERDTELRGMLEGRAGKNPDRSPSGKDMVLGHRCRRLGFTPDEVREILRAAPYPVDGGRTEHYLDRTVAAIFRTPTHARRRPRTLTEGFGTLPARLLNGTWAGLSFTAAKLYGVMAIRRLRPSGIVRDGHGKLARWAGISQDSVGPAASELEAKGLIRRAWRWRGVNYWVKDLTCTREYQAHVEPTGEDGTEREAEGEDRPAGMRTGSSTSAFSPEHVTKATPAFSPEQVVLVMSGEEPSATPPLAPVQTGGDGFPSEKGGPGGVAPRGRCKGLTKAGVECGLRAVAGGRFCRWHEPREESACVREG